MKKRFLFIAVTSIIVACSTSNEKAPEKSSEKKTLSLYVSADDKAVYSKAITFFKALPELAVSETNSITPDKISLGKALYLDTRLSKDGNISCNSCHKLDAYGVDNLPVSPGDEGKNGDRNSPSVYNAALHTSQFWDGRAAHVEEQAGMPILNPVEMNIPNEDFLVSRLKEIDSYKVMFAEAFPNDPNPISYGNLQKAIGAFERTLLTPSNFDKFLDGDENALTGDEKEGLLTFINVGCVSCHTGSTLGGNMFQKFGVYGNYWEYTGSESIDEGRFTNTGNESEKYIFKVPSLRNIDKTHPYLHDGSMSDLNEVIKLMGKVQLNKDLSEKEIRSIRTFLNCLTGTLPVSAVS